MSKEKESVQPDSRWNPLTAFIFAESRLAMQISQHVHQSLVAVNKALRSNATLQASQLETALDIMNLNVLHSPLSNDFVTLNRLNVVPDSQILAINVERSGTAGTVSPVAGEEGSCP